MTDASLWSGGRVFTGRRYAEAILVENGRVLYVGGADEARRLAPTGTEHRRLEGRLLIPGLVDAHLHIADLTRVREGFDLSPARSLEEMRDRLRVWASDHSTGPIVGRGWDPERWTDRTWPTVRDVDPVVGDRPVVLHHASGHAALLNSVALAGSGALATGAVPDPAMIGRFPDGAPNGLLFEEAIRRAGALVADRSSIEGEALVRTLGALSSYGLTAVAAMSASPEELRSLRELDEAGRLPITVRGFVRLAELSEYTARDLAAGRERFAVFGAKAYLDGAFGPRTASLRAPYADEPTTSGLRVGNDRQLADRLAEADARGLVPALHAIGDEAVARAAALIRDRPKKGQPLSRIEHASLTPPDLMGLLLEVRPTLVVQPGFVWSDHWLHRRLGPERARSAYAFRTLIDRGVRLAGSSDAPYDPVDPWRGLAAAVARRDGEGRSANPASYEALSLEEAVGLYTTHAAAALGLADRGRLEVGAPADLAVLRTPDLARAVGAVDPPVEETWVGGRRVYPGTSRRGE